MNKPRCYALCIFVGLWATVLCNCGKMEAKMAKDEIPFKEGGPCTYLCYEGGAEVVRITQTRASLAQSKVIGGAGYEGYEVWFRFVPESDIHDPRIGPLMGREHLFTLHNGWYVGPRYLKKYGIERGKKYPCSLKLIETGTCAPVVFDFKTVDTRDYFESRP